jgi:peroxiredoxin
LAAYQRKMDELKQLGVSVIGATVEDRETAARMAEEVGLSFPIAYGVTPDSVESLAPWWTEDERHGRYLQPTEFLLRRGIVLGSMYASGPIGRMDVDEATAFIRNRERR